MELGAHHVVIVACEDGYALTTLPVPDTYRLVVGTAQNPRVFVVEEGGADVIDVTQKGENAFTLDVVPYFDLIVVASGYEYRLLMVEADTSNGTVVFFELF